MVGTISTRNPDGSIKCTKPIGSGILAPSTINALAAIFAAYLLDEPGKEVKHEGMEEAGPCRPVPGAAGRL